MIKPTGPSGSPLAQVDAIVPSARADSGDTPALQVASPLPRRPLVETSANAASSAISAVAVKLSDAAMYLSQLLGAAPLQTASAAAQEAPAMRLGDPLATAPQRAESLALAMHQSGLFYESHLRAWAEGRLPLERLMNEPQARSAQALNDPSPAVRDDASAALGGLLQRQLDGLDGKPLAFSGWAWPGQQVEWRVQREVDDQCDDPAHTDESDDGTEPAPSWTTQLRLALPRLGALGATVRVVGSQVQLRLTLDNDASAELLHAHRKRLASALQAVGLTLAVLQVDPHDATQTPTSAA